MNRNQIHTRTTSMAALIFRGVLADPWSRIRPAMWLAEEEYSFNNRDIDFYRNRYRYRERKRRRRDETSAEKVRTTQEEEEELKEERKWNKISWFIGKGCVSPQRGLTNKSISNYFLPGIFRAGFLASRIDSRNEPDGFHKCRPCPVDENLLFLPHFTTARDLLFIVAHTHNIHPYNYDYSPSSITFGWHCWFPLWCSFKRSSWSVFYYAGKMEERWRRIWQVPPLLLSLFQGS